MRVCACGACGCRALEYVVDAREVLEYRVGRVRELHALAAWEGASHVEHLDVAQHRVRRLRQLDAGGAALEAHVEDVHVLLVHAGHKDGVRTRQRQAMASLPSAVVEGSGAFDAAYGRLEPIDVVAVARLQLARVGPLLGLPLAIVEGLQRAYLNILDGEIVAIPSARA